MTHHLSYPKGASIDDSIPPEFSSVKYAYVDDAISLIQRQGKGCAMAKTYVRRGSRILKWGVNFCNNVIESKPG